MTIDHQKKVWVFAEQRDGEIQPVVLEILTEARQLAGQLGASLSAVLLGHNLDHQPAVLTDYGAESVYVCDGEEFAHYNTDAYTSQLASLIQKEHPDIFFIGATHNGRDLGPRLASRLDTGLTADCTKLEIDPQTQELLMTRPAFSGNLMATIICTNHRPQMATIRPGVFKAEAFATTGEPSVIPAESVVKAADLLTQLVRVIKENNHEEDITKARIIVAGGRGLGKAEGFQLLETLAEKIGATVASSRAAVDAGWISAARQVGQTGKTVQPELYIACGISGAIQHLAGMNHARVIVAINKDKDAPIFKSAHYGLVGDLYQIIPELIKLMD